MVDREMLHGQVPELVVGDWRVRAIIHGMIDAGTVTSLECQYEDCVMEDRLFKAYPFKRCHRPKGLVVDHIVPRLQGGGDRPENLRILHATCNVARAAGWTHSEEAKERIRQACIARGGWSQAIAKRKPAWNRKVRDDDRRGGPYARKLTDEQVQSLRRVYAAGEGTIVQVAARFDVSVPTFLAARDGRGAYRNI